MKIVHDDGQEFELSRAEIKFLSQAVVAGCLDREELRDYDDKLPEWSLFEKIVKPVFGPWYSRSSWLAKLGGY